MKTKYFSKLFLLVMAFILVAAGCTTVTTSQSKVLTVGVFGPLTGGMAVGGTHQKEGIEYAIQKINTAGGLCDGKYSLAAIFADTEGNPENAVTIINKLLYKDNVIATMGSNNSPEVLAVLDLIAKAKTPHIVPSGVAMAITASGNEWVSRITASDYVFTKRSAEFAVKTLGHSKIAILFDTNDYGSGGTKLLEQYLSEMGVTPVLKDSFSTGTKDFTAQLLKIKEANVEALIIWANYTEVGQLVRQMSELGIKNLDVILSTGATIGNFFELAGATANGMYGVMSGFSPARTDKTAVDFMAEYEKFYSRKPDINDVLAYDAVNVLAEAIKNTCTEDHALLQKAIRSIKDFPGVSGTITFAENGEGGTNALMIKIVDGVNKTTELVGN
jgi:branched-chain amino acid transport system substrate-binding protein